MNTHTTPHLIALIAHLAACRALPAQLRTLHDLALYDSGDAKLGEEEKEALLNTKHLADLLQEVPVDDLRKLL